MSVYSGSSGVVPGVVPGGVVPGTSYLTCWTDEYGVPGTPYGTKRIGPYPDAASANIGNSDTEEIRDHAEALP